MGRNITKPDPDIGTSFGLWQVIGISKTINGERMLEVQCACGYSGFRLFANVTARKSQSCGCVNRVTTPKVGDTIGEWTLISMDGPYHAVVECSCGVVARRYIYTLGQDSLSCGHPIPSGYLTKYGKSGRARGNNGRERNKLKKIYALMVDRCADLANTNYGGRGISVDEAWLVDENIFADWSIANGFVVGKKLQLDRIDTDGNYGPSNCRWVTATENVRNRRNTRKATAWGETKAVAAWCEDIRCNTSYGTLITRLDRGMLPEDAISTPSHRAK